MVFCGVTLTEAPILPSLQITSFTQLMAVNVITVPLQTVWLVVVTVGTFGGFNTTICAALSPALVHEPIVQVAEYVVVAVGITV